MIKSHFTEIQILAAIQKQEKGIAVKDIVRTIGVSEQTFHKCKAKYGSMQAHDIRRLRDMVAERSTHRKLLGSWSLRTGS